MYLRHVGRFLSGVLLLLSLAAASAAPAIHGMPLLQRFSPDDYQAAAGNLDVLAAPDGMLYVGNSEGLLRFDGRHWERLELPRQSGARALALGSDGRIYVGGYDQFGVVSQDATGAMRYSDLRPAFGLDPQTAAFGTVWTITRGERGVYIQTTPRLFFLADDGNHRQWPSNEDVRSLFAVGTELYVRVEGIGLTRFVDGQFEPLPDGEQFASRPLSMLFDHPDGLLLVSDDGFTLATADGLRRLPGDADRVFADTPPYTGIRLPGGGYVFGTYSGELLHFDAGLRFIGAYPLGPFTVFDIEADREGGLWAATEGDLLRLRVPAPWSQFNAGDGLLGQLLDTAYHEGALWVATSQGVYRSRSQRGRVRFELAIETALEAYALRPVADGLLVGDREGVLLLRNGAPGAERIAERDTVFDFRPSKFDPHRIYVLGDQALAALQRVGDRWVVEHDWPLDGISIAEFHEASANEIWISDYRSGVVRWLLDPATGAIVERRSFGAADGLQTDPEYGTVANFLDGDMYVVSGQHVFRKHGTRFSEVQVEPFTLVEQPWDLAIEETAYGTYAATTRELWRRAPGSDRWQPVQFGAAVARGYYHVHVGADGMLRLITWSGLLQFDPDVPESELPPLAVGLRSLQRRLHDGSTEHLPIAAADTPVALPAGASLDLDFRLISMEPGSEFRFRIPGLIDQWSAWAVPSSPSLTLRHPGAGLYTIEIEGRTRGGRHATPFHLRIQAAPPWWQTPPAVLAALLALLLAVGGVAQLIARIRYRQYRALNRRLEQKITERTAELEAANRKLSELATEDSLTGVANRRALEQALLREWERCRELHQPLSVIMLDVDHFKQYNDVHGHLAGDQQLVRVARILSTHVRPVRELLARFGGEEFALVLPGIAIDDAVQRAETMRRSFAGPDPGPTISLGVATVEPSARFVPDDLVRAADMALYAAKRAGRNRVIRAAPLGEATSPVA